MLDEIGKWIGMRELDFKDRFMITSAIIFLCGIACGFIYELLSIIS